MEKIMMIIFSISLLIYPLQNCFIPSWKGSSNLGIGILCRIFDFCYSRHNISLNNQISCNCILHEIARKYRHLHAKKQKDLCLWFHWWLLISSNYQFYFCKHRKDIPFINISITWSHIFPDEKQTQYILRHWLFLQLHPLYIFLESLIKVRGGASIRYDMNLLGDF